MTQAPLDPVSRHGITDFPRHHKAHAHRLVPGCARPAGVYHHARTPGSHAIPHRLVEQRRRTHPERSRQHGSSRQLDAALAPAGRQDRAAGAGAHALPETVGAGTPAVARLKRALGHWSLRLPSCMLRSKQVLRPAATGRATAHQCYVTRFTIGKSHPCTTNGRAVQPTRRTRPRLVTIGLRVRDEVTSV